MYIQRSHHSNPGPISKAGNGLNPKAGHGSAFGCLLYFDFVFMVGMHGSFLRSILNVYSARFHFKCYLKSLPPKLIKSTSSAVRRCMLLLLWLTRFGHKFSEPLPVVETVNLASSRDKISASSVTGA